MIIAYNETNCAVGNGVDFFRSELDLTAASKNHIAYQVSQAEVFAIKRRVTNASGDDNKKSALLIFSTGILVQILRYIDSQ